MTVGEGTQFTIGSNVRCIDGDCGEVSRVVIDPVARTVTHLVVEPRHERGAGRLVAIDQVDTAPAGLQLRYTMEAFENLTRAEETEFLSPTHDDFGYGPGQVFTWPYYAGGAGMAMGMGMARDVADDYAPQTHDVVPSGEVAIRRGDQVHATDGAIGHVQGLVMDPGDHRVTHVLLQEGHLWGSKEVAIPIGAVATATEGIRLTITKQEVENLPAVVVDRSNG